MATVTKSKRVKPPLKWHGGKHYLAKKIIEQFPPHIHYVEPYFGGGAVLLQKPVDWIMGCSEVVNDIDGELANFWTCLREPEAFAEMQRLSEATAFDESVFNLPAKFENDPEVNFFSGDTAVLRAWRFFIRYRQSRQGLGKDFATLSRNRTRGGMNEQVSSWLTAVDGLPAVHERLKRVVILNQDALQVIKSQDGPNTLFYLDPPYLHETRVAKDTYQHEVDHEHHQKLLATLGVIEGKFILSGYPHPEYNYAQTTYRWRRVDIEIDNKASSKKTKDKKIECLWMNYDL